MPILDPFYNVSWHTYIDSNQHLLYVRWTFKNCRKSIQNISQNYSLYRVDPDTKSLQDLDSGLDDVVTKPMISIWLKPQEYVSSRSKTADCSLQDIDSLRYSLLDGQCRLSGSITWYPPKAEVVLNFFLLQIKMSVFKCLLRESIGFYFTYSMSV